MRKYKIKRDIAYFCGSYVTLDVIISEIDKICASPRETRADLLMTYRGRLYDLRSTQILIIRELEKELNIKEEDSIIQ